MCWNGPRQNDRIHFPDDLEKPLDPRLGACLASGRADLLRFCEDRFDALHPKLGGLLVSRRHNAKRWLALLHQVQRRNVHQFDPQNTTGINAARLLIGVAVLNLIL